MGQNLPRDDLSPLLHRGCRAGTIRRSPGLINFLAPPEYIT
jgi:hypothetical protein